MAKLGHWYVYNPVQFDILHPPFGCVRGDIVRVINLPGCPPMGTMGMCYVELDGRFAGMVMELEPLPRGIKHAREEKESHASK